MNPNPPDPMESDTSDNQGLDFDHWTSLISDAETSHPDDIEKLSSVYDSFLSEFPLCHGYWRRYADHKTRLCTIDKAVEVYESALESAMYSVQLWVDYCSFSMSFFQDPSDIRRLFKRGLSFVGRDYGCYALWDKYIDFEYSQQEWSSLARIYLQALRFPNKKLHHYYGSWKKLASLFEEEMNSQSNSTVELQSEAVFDGEVCRFYGDAEISLVVKDLLYPASGSGRSKVLQKYIYIGKQLYQEACELDEKISTFENNIRRTYFHVKPLSVSQLQNWHQYLDFVEMQGDFDWAVKLYERCLIPCAHYPEFWMRYVDFVEINGGREIANYSLDRATQIFVKRVSVIHLFNARFKEQIGDVLGARAALFQRDAASDPQFVKNVILKANMEKRMGNFTAASTIFREALEMAAEKKQFHTLPILYVHFSRLTYMMTDSADAARDVLIDGIKHVPHCKLLLEELIKFAMMNGGKQHLSVIDSIVNHAVSPESGVNAKDAEDIMSLYLEFVDLCGTIHEVRKVWSRTVQLFPHSMRPTSPDQKSSFTVFDQHVAFTQFSEVPREKDETSAAMPQQPSKDGTTDSLIVLPLHDAEMLLPQNHTNDCIQDPTYQILDQRMPLNGSQLEQTTLDKLQSSQPENIQEALPLPSSKVPREPSTDNTPESNLSSFVVEVKHGSPEILDKPIENARSVEVNQVRQEVSEQYRENVPVVEVKQVREEVSKEGTENIPESKLSSVELGCQVAERNKLIESSQEITKESNVHSECDYKSEQNLKPLSLENLSLNSQENTNKDPLPSTSLKGETSQEVCTSNGKKLESTCDSNQVSYRQSPRNARSLESAGNEIVNPMPIPVLSQQPVNSYGDWRQGNQSDKVYRDSKFGFRGQVQRKSHQKQHVPPQKYQRTDVGSPMPASQGHPFVVVPAQNQQIQQGSQQAQHHNLYQEASGHANITVPNAQPLPNVQHVSYASSSQSPLPVQSVGPQLSHSSILGNAQYAMQNSQTYNQMWQYYYYQQQQQFLVQQQMHQPQQQQQLLLQQYQQQQQYYVQMQQQQIFPLQQQQQFGPLQQQLPLQQQQYNQPLQLQQQLLQEQQQHPFYMQHHQQSHQQQSHVQEQQQVSPPLMEHHPHHQDQAARPQNNPDVYGGSVSSLSPNESAQE